MNAIKNVMLPIVCTSAVTLACIAGCKKVPPVIKETPTEQVDTTKLDKELDKLNTFNKATINIMRADNKKI